MSSAVSFVAFICGQPAGLWTFDLWITLPLLLSAGLYGIGLSGLWGRAGFARGIHLWRAGCYMAGWLVLVAALVSPIHRWGESLFSIHMIEHELVMAIAAPLLVLGRAGGAFAWALPTPLLRGLRHSAWRRAWKGLTDPAAATVIHGVAIWAWHIPVLFDAALGNFMLHRLQHVSFLATGLLFWWALLRRRNAGVAAAHLFATMLHTSVLGAIVALAPHILYRMQTQHAAQWDMTPLQDQQLAGLIMWIPAGLVYAGAALSFFAVWVRQSGAGTPAYAGSYDAAG